MQEIFLRPVRLIGRTPGSASGRGELIGKLSETPGEAGAPQSAESQTHFRVADGLESCRRISESSLRGRRCARHCDYSADRAGDVAGRQETVAMRFLSPAN